jgi:type I restriction enzyme S subunit
MVTLRSNRRLTGFTEAIQEHGYQGIRKGDLVIHAMDAFAGAVGVSDSDGKSSPVYAACTPTGSANPEYFAEIIREMARTNWIAALSRGVRERSTDFRYESFANQSYPVPPAQEQAAIVKYLRHAHARIDRAIATKRKLIVLLDEQKQAIIHGAVTRGTDPAAPLKDSGVPWLGDIPSHWKIRRAKNVLRKIDVRSLTGDEQRLTVSSRRGVVPRETVNVTMFEAASYVGHKLCWPGDLVINSLWAWGRGLGVANDHGIVSTAYSVYRCERPDLIQMDYLHELVRSDAFHLELFVQSRGVWKSRLQLTDERFLGIALPLPPLAEQEAITRRIQVASRELQGIQAKVMREIELLREFRTRLTSNVVTGQLDVRLVSASLPEFSEEIIVSSGDDAEEGIVEVAEEFLEEVDA